MAVVRQNTFTPHRDFRSAARSFESFLQKPASSKVDPGAPSVAQAHALPVHRTVYVFPSLQLPRVYVQTLFEVFDSFVRH
jgi:hypothetical protein